MFKKTLDLVAKEIDSEFSKKSPQELTQLKKEIGICKKQIAEKKEEIELFKEQIREIKANSEHQQELNTFVILVAELSKANKMGEKIPQSENQLFVLQQKYNVAGMYIAIEKLEERIKEELKKEHDGNEIIIELNSHIKNREVEIQQLFKKIESLKKEPIDDYVPPKLSPP